MATWSKNAIKIQLYYYHYSLFHSFDVTLVLRSTARDLTEIQGAAIPTVECVLFLAELTFAER